MIRERRRQLPDAGGNRSKRRISQGYHSFSIVARNGHLDPIVPVAFKYERSVLGRAGVLYRLARLSATQRPDNLHVIRRI